MRACLLVGTLVLISTSGGFAQHPGPGEDVIATITPTQIGDTSFTLTRLPNDPNGIVGYWAGARTGLNTQQVVFFTNGRVLLIDPIGEMAPSNAGSPCFVARQGPPGIEWASYTFDAAFVTAKLAA